MENDGLIKRIKNTPKSNILELQLTKKGLEMANLSEESESLKVLFSSLSEKERLQMESILQKVLIQSEKLISL